MNQLVQLAGNRMPKRENTVNFTIEYEEETDGLWLVEILGIPGALAYGKTINEAITRVEALALRVLAERLEHTTAVTRHPLGVNAFPAAPETCLSRVIGCPTTPNAHTSTANRHPITPIGHPFSLARHPSTPARHPPTADIPVKCPPPKRAI